MDILEQLIDMAMRREKNDLLIHYLKKYKCIVPYNIPTEKIKYLCKILKDINHPDLEAAYHEEIEQMTTLKKQKRSYEIGLNQAKMESDQLKRKMTKVEDDIISYQEKIYLNQEDIYQLFVSCPVPVQQIVLKKL